MGLDIVQEFNLKRRKRFNCFLFNNNTRLSPRSRTLMIIRVPNARTLTLLARFLLLALLMVSFPWLSALRSGIASIQAESVYGFRSDFALKHPELLPLLFHDLKNEGLFRLGDTALFMNNSDDGDDEVATSSCSQILTENEMTLVSVNDRERQSSIPNETFDFAFAYSFGVSSTEFIDRTLKIGGVLAIQLNHQDPISRFQKPSNYEIVYLRRLESTFMAMRKRSYAKLQQPQAFAKRKLLDFTEEEARKKALNKLEDVLLEPPRSSSRRSRTYLKRTRYLPDLMGDSLDLSSYPRRVFIDVGLPEREGGSGTDWFFKNYPTRNLEFEMYKIETVTTDVTEQRQQMFMSEWLRDNVEEEEYVVMKAEAEVVEEIMVKGDAMKLVDELFLECKPKDLHFGGRKTQSKSGRPYWECLALYGKLRDKGVAVHQWWG